MKIEVDPTQVLDYAQHQVVKEWMYSHASGHHLDNGGFQPAPVYKAVVYQKPRYGDPVGHVRPLVVVDREALDHFRERFEALLAAARIAGQSEVNHRALRRALDQFKEYKL